jgi:tRNA(Ile)-lysidine synthase
MIIRLSEYLHREQLCNEGDRILLAVSGGIDSVVMAHLFSSSEYDCAIAHCNFQLRGEDSKEDESFVRTLARNLKMPFFSKRFDVDERVQSKGISIQMAARELRYEWFEELLTQESFDLVATAHNKNDAVETFFLNLSRGSGIRGLKGISSRRENIIRPLLFLRREEIVAYSRDHGIAFREDRSNLEIKYQRNKIRHDVIPVMEQINPGFVESVTRSMNQMEDMYRIYKDAIEQKRRELFREHLGRITIDAAELGALQPLNTWLFELFSPYGFSRSQCEGIEHILRAGPGRRSISPSHQLYKDRKQLMLIPSPAASFDRFYLDGPEKHSALPFGMDMEVMTREELGEIPRDPMTACLDLNEVQFPLTIRRWMHGDYFYPLGMNQMKKLSDYFVDNKVPVPEKERTWIMASGKKIVWIMGQRIDHRFRISPQTRKVLRLRLHADVAS